MGIFETIFVQQFPAVHPLMHLVFGLEVRRAEFNQPFELKIKLVTHDGGTIAELVMQGQINATPNIPNPGQVAHLPQMLALGGIPFQAPGTYSLDIFVNGDHKRGLSFNVTQPPQPPQRIVRPGQPGAQP